MTWKLCEGLVDAIKSRLSMKLQDVIDAINTELNDGIEMRPAETIHVSEALLSNSTARGFEIGVVVDSMAVPQSGWTQGAYILPTYTVRVMGFVVHSDLEVRRRLMYRYARALVTVLDDAMEDPGTKLDGYGVGIGAQTAHSVAFEESYSQLAGRVTLTYTASKNETR